MDERQPDEPGNSGLIVLGYWQSQGQAVQREEHLEYVCDAPEGKTWFRIVTEAEAIAESQEMQHAVEKHFRLHREATAKSFKPASTVFFEQAIGLEAHIKREMPLFLTLRDAEGTRWPPPCCRQSASAPTPSIS